MQEQPIIKDDVVEGTVAWLEFDPPSAPWIALGVAVALLIAGYLVARPRHPRNRRRAPAILCSAYVMGSLWVLLAGEYEPWWFAGALIAIGALPLVIGLGIGSAIVRRQS